MSKFTKLVTKSLLRCNPTFKMLRKIKMFRHKTITNNLFLINTAKKLTYKVKNIMKIFNQSNQTRFLHIRFFNQQILVNLKPTLRQPIMEALNQTQTSCKCLNNTKSSKKLRTECSKELVFKWVQLNFKIQIKIQSIQRFWESINF